MGLGNRRLWARRACAVIAAASSVLALTSARASAFGVVKTSGTQDEVLFFIAATGEVNNLTITRTLTGCGPVSTDACYFLEDSGNITSVNVVSPDPVNGCTITDDVPAPVTVRCTDGVVVAPAINFAGFEMRDQNDAVDASQTSDDPLKIEGQDGSDTLIGSGAADELFGGSTDAGMDRLTGGPGADLLSGGPGIDRAIYTDSPLPTTITLDNDDNDIDGTGAVQENVGSSVESITGSFTAADTLTGNCTAGNTLAGQGGNDTLQDPNTAGCNSGDFYGGGPGNDAISGRGGTDAVTYTTNTAAQPIDVTLDAIANDLDGLGGTDNLATDLEIIYGGAGADTIDGSGAAQGVSLFGRAGDDTLYGSDFNDILRGELGADILDCGDGATDMYTINPDGNAGVGNCEVEISG